MTYEDVTLVGVPGSPLLSEHGIIQVSENVVLYEQCLRCPLFIDVNDALDRTTGQPIPGIALFIHLIGDDPLSVALDESHPAEPSGRLATLSTWRTHGPLAMRERFTN